MRANRILWDQIGIVFGLVLLGIWSATQWTAASLAYQSQLGAPWLFLYDWPVYQPFSFIEWWFFYDAYAPGIFVTGAYIAISGSFAGVIASVALSVWRARETKTAETFGSAHWASSNEIRQAGLLGEDGVILGDYEGQYLRHDGPEHVLCYAPTRTGKGVGLVIPTLLTWPASAIINDIKGENWQQTAWFRSTFGRVLMFDPTNSLSSAYNPLLEIRKGRNEVRDAQNIADVLVDPDGSLEKRNHWEKTSHALLVGAILHVLYAEPDKSLAGVAKLLTDPERSINTVLEDMMYTKHLGDKGAHPVVARAARSLLNKSENERSSVLSTAVSFIELFNDPVIADVTSRCDWRIADLITGADPVSLYLVVPPSDLSRTRPLIRLILNQIGRRLTEELDHTGTRRRVLLMLDEFPALGRLDFFESALAFMAGYGLKAFLITQSLNQIDKAYGDKNSILDNCHVQVAFATNDGDTAESVSDGLGMTTQVRGQQNFSGSRLAPWLGHVLVMSTETARPLLTQGEVRDLPTDEELVRVNGLSPIKAKKARFYEDARLVARILPPPQLPLPSLATKSSDDWSGLPKLERPTIIPKEKPAKPKTKKQAKPKSPNTKTNDTANGGIRREAELPPHEDIVPKPRKRTKEFNFDVSEIEARKRAEQIRQQTHGITRGAQLDPKDGLGL